MDRIVIVGGGISGLSLAYYLLERDRSLDVVVFESEQRVGGKIWTEKAGGFLCEAGVNGFLDNRPKTLELSEKIALKPLRSNDASRKRFIFSGGRLCRLPESPPAFFMSGLLSIPGRLRVVGEALRPGGAKDEESLAAFATRRLGREAYEKLIDPMASGIYAGNPEVLSLRACFPKVYELERKYGGLIRGMIRLQREKRRHGSSEKVGAGPGGTLTSYYDGMGEIVRALKTVLGERVQTGRKVLSVDRKGSGFSLSLADGSVMETDTTVLAVPAYAASEILKGMDRRLAYTLSEIPYPAVSVVCCGYRSGKVKASLDGFGFLVPSREKRRVLGTLFDSSIFPNRAPEGHVLLRSMVGGARASGLAMESETRLVEMVTAELSETMGIRSEPDFVRVYRWEMAIPQYTVGHLERLRSIDASLERHEGLYVTGNAFRGVSVNDCIENSFRLSERIIEES